MLEIDMQSQWILPWEQTFLLYLQFCVGKLSVICRMIV